MCGVNNESAHLGAYRTLYYDNDHCSGVSDYNDNDDYGDYNDNYVCTLYNAHSTLHCPVYKVKYIVYLYIQLTMYIFNVFLILNVHCTLRGWA